MSYEDRLRRAAEDLEIAQRQIQDALRNYPSPVSGCDAQYNHLIGLRGSISQARRLLQAPRFVATPREPERGARVESR